MVDSVYRPKPGTVTESVTGPDRRTLLVVEDDKVGSRYLEIQLTRAGYRIEVAHDGAAALDILGFTVVDLVLCDLHLPDMDGFQLFRRVRREGRCRQIPFLVVSSDTRLETKVQALELGIEDYVTKPYEMAELKARIDAAVRRLDASRAAFQQRRYNLAGDFTGMSFPDLINLLDLGRRTGTLSVVTPRAAAEIRIREGRILYAAFGNVIGEEAFYAILGEPQGQFEFAPGDVDPVEGVPPLAASCTGLLMEGARRLDSARAGEIAIAGGGETVPIEESLAPARQIQLPAAVPDPLVALEFADAVSDPFALGEIQLLHAGTLREFSTLDTFRTRLHGLLIADPEPAAAALAALASPLTDRQIHSTLIEPVQTLALLFALRNERMIDLVLLDQAAPAAFLDWLQRRPSFVILAPRQGDWLSFGVQTQVGLVALLQRLQPLTLIALGNPSVQQGMEELQARAGTSIPTRLVKIALEQPGADFRDVVLEAIGAWADCAPSSGVVGGAGEPNV